MSDEYDCAATGKLKLKNDALLKKKKKKKRSKEKERELAERALSETIGSGSSTNTNATSSSSSHTTTGGGGRSADHPKLTKAELAFKKQQEKMRNKRIMEKASTTHKERVEKFNEHLDTLTEHFDIPKVSWTK